MKNTVYINPDLTIDAANFITGNIEKTWASNPGELLKLGCYQIYEIDNQIIVRNKQNDLLLIADK